MPVPAHPGPPPVCPLSGSDVVERLATIRTADIALLYERYFGIDVREDFGSVETLSMWRSSTSDLVFFDPPVTGGSAFYAALSRIEWYYAPDKYEFRFAQAHLPATGRVLEVGCGPAFFGTRVGTDRYVGLETSPTAVALAEERGLRIERVTIEEYAARAPESADALVSFQVLEHVAAPGSFLKACAQALKPGGTMVVSVPSSDGFMGANLNDALNLPPHHVTWWSNRCLMWCADFLGLELQTLHTQRLSDGPHRRWYCKNLIDRALLSFVGLDLDGPVTTDPLWFKFQPLSDALAGILQHGYTHPSMDTAGHTVIAVLRKPG